MVGTTDQAAVPPDPPGVVWVGAEWAVGLWAARGKAGLTCGCP